MAETRLMLKVRRFCIHDRSSNSLVLRDEAFLQARMDTDVSHETADWPWNWLTGSHAGGQWLTRPRPEESVSARLLVPFRVDIRTAKPVSFGQGHPNTGVTPIVFPSPAEHALGSAYIYFKSPAPRRHPRKGSACLRPLQDRMDWNSRPQSFLVSARGTHDFARKHSGTKRSLKTSPGGSYAQARMSSVQLPRP